MLYIIPKRKRKRYYNIYAKKSDRFYSQTMSVPSDCENDGKVKILENMIKKHFAKSYSNKQLEKVSL